MILTEGYVKGFEDCLDQIIKMIDTTARKPMRKGDLVELFNEILGNIYSKQIEVMEMQSRFEQQINDSPDPLACQCETAEETIDLTNVKKLTLIINK